MMNHIANAPTLNNINGDKILKYPALNSHECSISPSPSLPSFTIKAPNAQSSGTLCTLFVNLTLKSNSMHFILKQDGRQKIRKHNQHFDICGPTETAGSQNHHKFALTRALETIVPSY